MHARILTLNVENRAGDPRRQELVRAGIERIAPDLVSLQEVIDSADYHQHEELLAGTGLEGTHQSELLAYDPPWADRYGGTVLASRWPYRVVEVLDLRQLGADDVPWCSMAAVVQVPGVGEMVFIATTASWRLDATAVRERQALALSDLDARHRRELPSVIAGDLNADPDQASIRFLTGRQSLGGRSVYYSDAWEIAGAGPGYTWSIDNPNAREVMDQIVRQPAQHHRFDYVLVGSAHAHPDRYCRVEKARLAFDEPSAGIWASDHFGLIIDVDIGPPASAGREPNG